MQMWQKSAAASVGSFSNKNAPVQTLVEHIYDVMRAEM